jgi:hypothetical protein
MAKTELTDLIPGENYQLQVRAIGENGIYSDWSENITFTAPENRATSLLNLYQTSVGDPLNQATTTGILKSANFNGIIGTTGNVVPNFTTTATAASGASSIVVASSTNIYVGQTISGNGIATGTKVSSSYVPGSTTVPITINTTAILSSTTIKISSEGDIGWSIDYAGYGIFNNVFVRGNIQATSGIIGGFTIPSLDPNSLTSTSTQLDTGTKTVAMDSTVNTLGIRSRTNTVETTFKSRPDASLNYIISSAGMGFTLYRPKIISSVSVSGTAPNKTIIYRFDPALLATDPIGTISGDSVTISGLSGTVSSLNTMDVIATTVDSKSFVVSSVLASTPSVGSARYTATGHTFVVNDIVQISGASVGGYNGTYTITAVATNTFTVANANITFAVTAVNDSSPAVGSATYTSTGHNFIVGDSVTISGASVAGYNGTFTITAVATNTFTVTNATTGAATFTSGRAVPAAFTSGLALSGSITVTNYNTSIANSLYTGQYGYVGSLTVPYLLADQTQYDSSNYTIGNIFTAISADVGLEYGSDEGPNMVFGKTKYGSNFGISCVSAIDGSADVLHLQPGGGSTEFGGGTVISTGRVGYNFSGTSSITTTRAFIAPSEGFVWATRAGTPLVLQRTGTNGTVATFYNDTVQSGYLAVGTSSFQLYGSVTLQLSSGSSNVNLDPGSHLTGNSVIYGDVSNTGPRGLIISNSTGGYVIGTASSTRRVKQQISDFEWDAESILKIVPKKFKYNSDVENFGDNANWAYGLLAEDLDDLGLEGLINRDEQGLPDYVSYEKVGVALISVVKYQQETIKNLESRIALLEK